MPTPAEDKLLAYEQEIRKAAQRTSIDHRFTPRVLLENSPEAFMTWVVTYFPHKVAEWEDWQIEPVSLMVTSKRFLVMVPAGTMKTTVGAELLPMWWLCQFPNYEILGVFKNDEENKKSLRAIKAEFTMNELLIKDYGPFFARGAKWTEHMVDVAKRTRRSKQPSLYYLPYGGQALGNRCHKGFFDDLVTREMAFNPEQTRKFMSWLAVDFENAPYAPDSTVDWEPGMTEQVGGYGTRMSRDDAYAKIEERNEQGDPNNADFTPYRVSCIDIIKDESKQETISQRWPWSKLMAKKMELQEPAFSMRMRNKVGTPETQIFKEPWVRGGTLNGVEYPGNRDHNLSYFSANKGDKLAIGYDPQSGSTTRWAKYAALVAIGVTPDPDGKWVPYLFDWWKGQTPPTDKKRKDSQVNVILGMAMAANDSGIVPTVVLEDNNVQAGFKEPILDAAQEKGVQLRVELVKTTSVNKNDAETGIENCASDFQNGWMHLPFAMPADEEKTIQFEGEMIGYGTSKYSDVPMAWWFARAWLYENRWAPRRVQVIRQQRLPRYMERRYGLTGAPRFARVISAHAMPVEVDHGD